ncbi:MAG: GIY-YIG nuclease family protein [Candidatus Aminicenantes bacterium]|nr:GIY-YIG nuclease family protein [Candidatus Aminicenantes bacterium]
MSDLKTQKKLFKQTPRPMGIYQIKNLANDKIYIGRSADLNGKINSERFQLRNNMHMNRELQGDFNALGEEKFAFEVLDRLPPKEEPGLDYGEDLKTLEVMWLEKLRPFGARGYHKQKP